MKVEIELDDGAGAVRFEWDSAKDYINLKKHGISFEEAAHIFLDEPLTIEDTSAHDELREISYGRIGDPPGATVLVCVVHTDREGTIRIISARKATAHEKKRYDAHIAKTYH